MANLNPGPINTELLHSNDEHRAKHVFNGGIPADQQLVVRRHDMTFWTQIGGVHEDVMKLVRDAGFAGILEVGNSRQIDNALITSLVERWRPETHTFHLPIGEATVTLQDVQILWGLPVEGEVVTGSDLELRPLTQYPDWCEQLMGFRPERTDFVSGQIKLSALLREMNRPLPLDPTREEIEQKARVVMLHLIGGTLFCNNTGNRVGVYHLQNLVELGECGNLSWGSAVLACLYRSLCNATNYQATMICGPMGLLQLWAWERFEIFKPRLRDPNFHFESPLGARWFVPQHHTHITSHVLQACRSQLTNLTNYGFNWTPYSEEELAKLPALCIDGRNSWRCRTYLIYWEVVETYSPNRVLRQFGMFQPIPQSPPLNYTKHKFLHDLTRHNRRYNWEHYHQEFINDWDQRHNYIEDGGVGPSGLLLSDEYLRWYREHTVIFISNVNSLQQGFQHLGEENHFLMGGITQLYNQSSQYLGVYPPSTQGYEAMQHTANQYGQYVQGQNWMQPGPYHFQENYQPDPPQNIYRQRRGRRNQPEPEPQPDPQPDPQQNPNLRVDDYDIYSSMPYTGPPMSTQPGPSNYMAGTSNIGANLYSEEENYYTPLPPMPTTTDYTANYLSPNYYMQDMGQHQLDAQFNIFSPVGFPNLSSSSYTQEQPPGVNLNDDDVEPENMARRELPRRDRRRRGCGTGGCLGDH